MENLNLQYIIGVDYQIDSVLAILCASNESNHISIIKTYMYYSKRDGHKTDEDIYNDLLKLTNPYRDKNKITLSIDPSAASFIHYVKQHNDFKLSICKSLYNTKNIKTQGRKITND